MVKNPDNTVWIGLEYFCTEGDKMWTMSDEDFINFAIDELCKIDVISKDNVKDSIRIKVKKHTPLTSAHTRISLWSESILTQQKTSSA